MNKEQEKNIIARLSNLPNQGYGGYQFIQTLNYIIADEMGFKIIHYLHGGYGFGNDSEKVWEIRDELTKKNIIKWSKSGVCFKLVKAGEKPVNSWFRNTFLKSFKEGETQITEKQYKVFAKNLKGDEFIDGYIAGYTDIIDGFKLKAYSWETVNGTKYYIEKEKI